MKIEALFFFTLFSCDVIVQLQHFIAVHAVTIFLGVWGARGVCVSAYVHFKDMFLFVLTVIV